MKATPIVSVGAALVLFVSTTGCASSAPRPADAPSTTNAVADLAPGQYELWIDHRCRREARRFSKLGDDAYMRVASEKRFVVFRTADRIVLRSVDAPGVELEAIPHHDVPGVYAIKSASGGLLTLHEPGKSLSREGPSERRAELVLFGTGLPYLACDRGSLRAVASL